MLFLFLRFALLGYCLFSLVWASPMKPLKITEEATVYSSSSSSSTPKKHRHRFSTYQIQQDPVQGAFECPNGQIIDVKILLNLAAYLCHKTIIEMQEKRIMADKVMSSQKLDIMVYPIDSEGKLAHQSASKDPSTRYEVTVHQYKQTPRKCLPSALTFKSGTQRQYCSYTPLRHSPVNPSIFKEQGKKGFDCNGVIFQPHQVYLSMLAAKKALHERLVSLQLALQPKAKEGFPHPFESGVFNVEDTWMFPILPGTNSLYNDGNPGIYSVVITGTGKPVGVVYLKTQEQYLRDIKRKGIWTKTPDVHRYEVCKVKDVFSN